MTPLKLYNLLRFYNDNLDKFSGRLYHGFRDPFEYRSAFTSLLRVFVRKGEITGPLVEYRNMHWDTAKYGERPE